MDPTPIIPLVLASDRTSAPEPVTHVFDATGYDQFCQAEYRSVLGLAYVLTGDAGAAQDLTQDAFFAAFRDWNRLSSYDRPGAWVRRVVANKAVSRRRRQQSEGRALERIGNRRDVAIELEPLDDEVWQHVRQLPFRQAQVLALTYLHDLSVAEVASILGIATGTVKKHLFAGRTNLAARLRTSSEVTP